MEWQYVRFIPFIRQFLEQPPRSLNGFKRRYVNRVSRGNILCPKRRKNNLLPHADPVDISDIWIAHLDAFNKRIVYKSIHFSCQACYCIALFHNNSLSRGRLNRLFCFFLFSVRGLHPRYPGIVFDLRLRNRAASRWRLCASFLFIDTLR